MDMISYDQYRDSILDVDLDAPPTKRWASAVSVFGDEVHEVVHEVVSCCEETLEDIPPVLRYLYNLAIRGAVDVTGRVVGLVAAAVGQEYSTEIKSIARLAGVSYPQLLLGNMMYDICQIWEHREGKKKVAAIGCSSFSCDLPNGKPVLARNMDWAFPDTIGRHTILMRFHRGRCSYLAVGIVGKVGVLSAMRTNHWAVTLNQAPAECLRPRILQIPALQRIRQVCDRMGGYSDVIRRIQEYQTMSPFFAHIVGTKSGQHCVVNGFCDSFSVRRASGPALIQTNHYVDDEYEHLNGTEEWLEDGCIWTWDSRPRYRSLQRRLKQLPKSADEALKKLRREPITNENTMQSMVLCPSQDGCLLKVRA